MSVADLISNLRSGIVQITFRNDRNERVGGGTGFLSRSRLLTNHHVFMGYLKAGSVQLRREGLNPIVVSPADFGRRLRSGSEEKSYDYAILDLPELIDGTEHQFLLEIPGGRRIGDVIGVLGYPLEHTNLTFHQGIISSFYTSNITKVIQLDASINAGNSGGPLIDTETGAVFGMVSRRATGLTRLFDQLRQAVRENIQFAERTQVGVSMSLGGFDPVEGFKAGQNQILATLDEIERQANVGIGYAISAEHLLSDTALPRL